MNLAKYRKLQHDLEESEARVEMAENVVGQMRSKGRTATVSETTSVCDYFASATGLLPSAAAAAARLGVNSQSVRLLTYLLIMHGTVSVSPCTK